MMMLITIVHVLACVILVLVVLLQAGKGADMGAVFGGASSTIFGSSGAGNFLTRLTTGAAIVFMATSLVLTYGSTRSGTATLMPESVAPAVPDAPAQGEAAPGTESEAAPGAGAEAPAGAPAGDEDAAGNPAAPAEGAAPGAAAPADQGAAAEPPP